jgi:predicted small secreted protein
MKKILAVVSLLAVLLTACSDGIPEKIKDKAGSITEITQVKPSYIVELFDNQESFIYYYGSSVCGACLFMKDINSEVVRRTGIPMYFIETDKTSKEQLALLTPYLVLPGATPTYVIVLNGVVKETFTPEILVGDDTGFVTEHINLYTVHFISVLREKGLLID